MQIDKLLYNLTLMTKDQERQQYIIRLEEQILIKIKQEIIENVQKLDPTDQNTIEQIHMALKAYQKLLKNKLFAQMSFGDQEFVMNVGFYIGHEKNNDNLVMALQLVEHQVFKLRQKKYLESANLFKSLSRIYESIDEKYYERVVYLMMEMISNDCEFLSLINEEYYFLQCLIQVVNMQQKDSKLIFLFQFLRKLYLSKKTQLFHYKDLKILVEIILRILINSQNETLFQETLRLYTVLKQNSILKKEAYKQDEIKEAINDKFSFVDFASVTPSLKNIILEILGI